MPGRSGARRAARRALLVVVGGLYAASIPWYRAADATPAAWLGLPDWVAVALVCYVGAAFANAGAWLLTDVDDGDAAAAGSGPDATGLHAPSEPPGASGPAADGAS